MDEVSLEHLERLAPELLPLCAGVDDACALVRVQTRWDRFVDGTTRLLQTADFAREPDAAPIVRMRDAVGETLDVEGLEYQGLEEEEQRLCYADGERTVHVWPAWTLLLEAACEVLRVDCDKPAMPQPPELALAAQLARVAGALGLDGDRVDVSSEALVDPDALDRLQARRARVTRLGTLASSRLQAQGYAPPEAPEAPWAASIETERGAAAVQVWPLDDRVTLEVTCLE